MFNKRKTSFILLVIYIVATNWCTATETSWGFRNLFTTICV